MSAPRTRAGGFLAVLALVGLAVPTARARGQSAGETGAVAYRVHLAMGGDTVSFPAVTGRDLSAFLDASGSPTLLAGEAVGGMPVTPLPISLLQDAWTELPGPMPTLLEQSPFGSGGDAATLDSMRVELRDAGPGPSIQGHATRHVRLRVETFSVNVDPAGGRTPFRGVGTADLWFASDLPFSWLPFAGQPGPTPEAVPLAFWLPWASTHVARGLAPRLQKLGLLLRAEVLDSLVAKSPPGAARQLGGAPPVAREIWVDSVGPAASAPPAGRYAGMQHISELRMRLAMAVPMIAAQGCRAMASRRGGSFDLQVTGTPATKVSGRAFSLPPETGTRTGPAHLILEAGDAAGPATTCLWIDLPEGTVRTGSVRLSASAGPDPSAARAFEVVMGPGGREPRAMALVETGTLHIRSVDGGSISGSLEGTGWSLEVDPARTPPRGTLLNDLGFELEFEAVRVAPGSDDTGDGAAGSAPSRPHGE